MASKQPPVSNGPNHELAHGEDGEDDEAHHFLEGHTALKFLLAGGIAGAGGFIPLLVSSFTILGSITHLYCTPRSAENIPYHKASRIRRPISFRCQCTNNWSENHYECGCSYLFGRWDSCFLDRKWHFCSQDFPGIGHQILCL